MSKRKVVKTVKKKVIKKSVLKSRASKFKEIDCAFCKGKGKDPFEVPSKLSNCQVCFGKGKIMLFDQPHETCLACRGSGVFAHHRLPCSVCRGKGMVPKNKRSECERGLEIESGLPEIGCY